MQERNRQFTDNKEIQNNIHANYSNDTLLNVQALLKKQGTLSFESTTRELFPAAATADSENTGYKYVWVRDNIYVAYAHYIMGDRETTAKTLMGLMAYFQKFSFRFADIIENPELKEQVMKRPNIRFNGEALTEIDEDWEHAQNDALGYFLWLYCKLAKEWGFASPLLSLAQEESATLLQFMRYFNAIRYWEDADSGHWEEGRKVSASSIGPVVAGLKALRAIILNGYIDLSEQENPDDAAMMMPLIRKGEAALDEILPWESRNLGGDSGIERRYDAALLYLIYPLKVVSQQQAETILSDVKEALMGNYGIARYPYDSFWCRDFQDLDKSIQTAKYTGREAWLKDHDRAVKRGEEAQWCIFDPIISAIYGEWFQESGDDRFLELQTLHFNRALGQITGEGNTVDGGAGNNEPVEIPAYRCPELYYLQHDEYVPNVSTPLLWTQANLCIALKLMERSLAAD